MLVQTALPEPYFKTNPDTTTIQEPTILNSVSSGSSAQTASNSNSCNTVVNYTINMNELDDLEDEGEMEENPILINVPSEAQCESVDELSPSVTPKKFPYNKKYLNNSSTTTPASKISPSEKKVPEKKVLVVKKTELHKILSKRKSDVLDGSTSSDLKVIKALKIKQIVNGKETKGKIVNLSSDASQEEIMDIIQSVTSSIPDKNSEIKGVEKPLTKPPVDTPTKQENSQINEFIFNGEMYVQMPKKVFEEEKQKLEVQIENYRKLLHDIKSQLDKVE